MSLSHTVPVDLPVHLFSLEHSNYTHYLLTLQDIHLINNFISQDYPIDVWGDHLAKWLASDHSFEIFDMFLAKINQHNEVIRHVNKSHESISAKTSMLDHNINDNRSKPSINVHNVHNYEQKPCQAQYYPLDKITNFNSTAPILLDFNQVLSAQDSHIDSLLNLVLCQSNYKLYELLLFHKDTIFLTKESIKTLSICARTSNIHFIRLMTTKLLEEAFERYNQYKRIHSTNTISELNHVDNNNTSANNLYSQEDDYFNCCFTARCSKTELDELVKIIFLSDNYQYSNSEPLSNALGYEQNQPNNDNNNNNNNNHNNNEILQTKINPFIKNLLTALNHINSYHILTTFPLLLDHVQDLLDSDLFQRQPTLRSTNITLLYLLETRHNIKIPQISDLIIESDRTHTSTIHLLRNEPDGSDAIKWFLKYCHLINHNNNPDDDDDDDDGEVNKTKTNNPKVNNIIHIERMAKFIHLYGAYVHNHLPYIDKMLSSYNTQLTSSQSIDVINHHGFSSDNIDNADDNYIGDNSIVNNHKDDQYIDDGKVKFIITPSKPSSYTLPTTTSTVDISNSMNTKNNTVSPNNINIAVDTITNSLDHNAYISPSSIYWLLQHDPDLKQLNCIISKSFIFSEEYVTLLDLLFRRKHLYALDVVLEWLNRHSYNTKTCHKDDDKSNDDMDTNDDQIEKNDHVVCNANPHQNQQKIIQYRLMDISTDLTTASATVMQILQYSNSISYFDEHNHNVDQKHTRYTDNDSNNDEVRCISVGSGTYYNHATPTRYLYDYNDEVKQIKVFELFLEQLEKSFNRNNDDDVVCVSVDSHQFNAANHNINVNHNENIDKPNISPPLQKKRFAQPSKQVLDIIRYAASSTMCRNHPIIAIYYYILYGVSPFNTDSTAKSNATRFFWLHSQGIYGPYILTSANNNTTATEQSNIRTLSDHYDAVSLLYACEALIELLLNDIEYDWMQTCLSGPR